MSTLNAQGRDDYTQLWFAYTVPMQIAKRYEERGWTGRAAKLRKCAAEAKKVIADVDQSLDARSAKEVDGVHSKVHGCSNASR